MAQEKTSQPQKVDSKATKQPAKPPANEPVGSFEELLALDPKQVKKIQVLPKHRVQ